MTSVDVRSNPKKRKDRPTDEQQRKAVLFCPVCGHESPIGGRWTVTTTESQQEFRCPECEHVVAVR